MAMLNGTIKTMRELRSAIKKRASSFLKDTLACLRPPDARLTMCHTYSSVEVLRRNIRRVDRVQALSGPGPGQRAIRWSTGSRGRIASAISCRPRRSSNPDSRTVPRGLGPHSLDIPCAAQRHGGASAQGVARLGALGRCGCGGGVLGTEVCDVRRR